MFSTRPAIARTEPLPRRASDRGLARREIVAAAALGLSVLALVVPAVWVSRLGGPVRRR